MNENVKNRLNRNKPKIAVLVRSIAIEGWVSELKTVTDSKNTDPDFERGVDVTLPDTGKATVYLFAEPERAFAAMRTQPMNTILIDNRSDGEAQGFMNTLAGNLIPDLLGGVSVHRPPARNTILVILPDGNSTVHHAYAIGTLQLGGMIVAPKSATDALKAAHRILRPKDSGKIALCLAGGGIEGMFYELGVLRAIDAHLKSRSLIDFDVFSGISAGAILCSFLCNGVRPSEITDALHGRPSRITPVTRSVLFDPNLGEVTRRILGAVGDMMRGRFLTSPVDSAMKVTPTALFSGEKMRDYLETEFTKPGMTNNFKTLSKHLFIGATDQDTGTHVTFGTEGYDDVTVSSAIRASTAMTPYYTPEKIGDRYFVDGIFTRTIDLDVAVASGARLIICIDPLRPVAVDQPGYVSGRGGFFNTVQSIKSMIRTRLSEVIDRAGESYPDVTVYVFSPTPKDMENMSGTMMRFFHRTETEQMAFESASKQIENDFEWLSADLASYGFTLTK